MLQPAGTVGDIGRGTFIGPDTRTLDVTAMKNTATGEHVRLQFRTEAFDVTNRVNSARST